MGAFMKYKYGGWIPSIPVITNNGTYSLNTLTSSTGQCYRINSPSSSTEYFVVEYRRKTGTFENSLPGSGLLVYRINTTVGDGNAEGPPDEVYIYRPGGTTTANGTISSAHFSSAVGRTAINSSTNPTPFLTSGAAGGLDLSAIGAAGTTISFTNNGGINAGTPTCEITSPADEAVYNLGESITVNVTATDTRSVSRVEFYLDGAASPAYTDYSSPYAWVWNTTSSTAGVHTIQAKVIDNQSLYATDQISVYLLAPADEGFESGNFNSYAWSNTSAVPWTVQNTEKFSGAYAAKSGATGHGTQTSLSINLTINSSGTISFYQRVSSESGYDYLKFYIDGVEQGSWSGEGSWTLQSYPVSTGSRTFTWTYSKDGSVSNGSDCAWLDHIIFPPHVIVTPPTITWNPASISKEMLPDAATSQTLQIGNSGDQTLNYSCSLPTGSSTILDENFENGGIIPTGWTQTNVSGTAVNWIFVTGGVNGYPSAAYDGAYNARLSNGSRTASVTRLSTPYLNLSGAISASLSFWHTQAAWSGDQDELRVYYRTSSSGSWTLLNEYTNNITAWTQETISLPNLSGTYQIGFEGTAKWGYGVCLDKVVVTAQTEALSPWLSLNGGTTASGSIAEGGANHNISVGFNSAGLTPGDYSSTITVTSNSASNSSFTIPVSLTVLPPLPEINVSVTSLAYGIQMINTTQSQSFQISNTGATTLSGNISTPAGYTVALGSNPQNTLSKEGRQSRGLPQARNTLAYSVASGATQTFAITFNPSLVQAYNGNVTITHNAAGNSKTIALTGQGGKPTIGFSATSFTKNLAPGQTDTQSLSLSNSGNLALNYSLAISGSPAWLSFNGNPTASGSIAVGGAAQSVPLSINAAGLAPATYNATIVCSSNDPSTPSQNISVALTVRVPIAISAPTTGANWPGGSLRNIVFGYSGAGSSVTLYHSFDNGSTWSEGTVINVVSGTNTYGWIVPNHPSTTCKIKLVDSVLPNAERISNSFTISAPTQALITITAPVLNTVWEIEESCSITWTHLLLHPEVELFYSLDNGLNWVYLATVPASDQSYTWLSPATPSTQCLIRIWDAMDHNSAAISEVFTLTNPVPPSIPQNLQITYLEGSVILSWSPSTGNPTGYRIYRSSDVEFLPEETELVDTRPATETSVSIPASGNKAFYRVTAYRN